MKDLEVDMVIAKWVVKCYLNRWTDSDISILCNEKL